MNNHQSPYLFPAGSQIGRNNLVLHAQSRHHTVEGFEGTLSIKTVFRGQVTWMIGGRPLCVDTNTLLILNEGEKYSLNIHAKEPVETRCVFFRRGFVEQVAHNLMNSLQASLDNPENKTQLHFPARLHSNADFLQSEVWTLVKNYSSQFQPSGFQEDILTVAVSLLKLHKEILHQMSKVPAEKTSTKKELFRRLQIAKEYLHSCIHQPISLDEVARIACLSPYHFHRAFRQTFQTTPHHYLTDLKLKRARKLLKEKKSVTETAEAIGFSSVPSFSRLFTRRFGISPSILLRN